MAFVPSVDPAPAAPWVQGPADTIVPPLLTEAATLANTAQANALQALAALANFRPVISAIEVPNIDPGSPPQAAAVGIPPSSAELAANFPAAPEEPTFEALPGLSLPVAPDVDVTPPALADVPLPDPFSALLPVAPALADPDLPVEPGFAIPPVPTLVSLDLPAAPVLSLPIFDEALPDAPLAPDVDFAWSEVEYATDLLSQMNGRLLDITAGGSTGLDPAVEAAIWQRGRDRESLLTQRAIEEATRLCAAKGFAMPQGTLLRVVQQALQDSIARDASLSRDVMVKQAELEQSNFQFAFNLAVQLESALIGHFNNVQSRAFEAQKLQRQLLLDVFNAQVQLFNARSQAFGIQAQVFETRLKAALAQLEVYKAQLEAQRTIAEINRQQAAIFQAQIDGVKALVEVYRARVEAVKVKTEVDKNKVDAFRAQVEAYDSQVKAKASEYEGYASRIKAEATKVDMFRSQVEAKRSQVDAFGTLVNAKLAEQNFYFKQLQEFPLELWKGRVAAFATQVQGESSRLQAEVSRFDAQVREYAAVESAKHGHDEISVASFREQMQRYTAQAQIHLQGSVETIKAALAQYESIAASMRAAAQVAGQLSAAALAARHVSASIASNTSNSAQNSAQNSAHNTSQNSASNSDQRSSSNIEAHYVNENYAR